MKLRKRNIMVTALVLALVLFFSPVSAFAGTNQPSGKSKSDWQIVQELCRKEGYSSILVIDSNRTTDKKFWRTVNHRKGKGYIVVEKVVSKSDGTGYGWYSTKTKGTNYIIGYNKRVAKGRKVTSYVIWNPRTNYEDDILYVVDNRTFR